MTAQPMPRLDLPLQSGAAMSEAPRAKTHRAWRYLTLEPGVYLWTSPFGYQYLVNGHGTRDLDKLDHRCTLSDPPDQ